MFIASAPESDIEKPILPLRQTVSSCDKEMSLDDRPATGGAKVWEIFMKIVCFDIEFYHTNK